MLVWALARAASKSEPESSELRAQGEIKPSQKRRNGERESSELRVKGERKRSQKESERMARGNQAKTERESGHSRAKTRVTKEKPRRSGEAFFFLYSISSEYQIQGINPPKFSEGIRMEVAWNERQHFSTVGEKLDNFSTLRGFPENRSQRARVYRTQLSQNAGLIPSLFVRHAYASVSCHWDGPEVPRAPQHSKFYSGFPVHFSPWEP